MKQQITSQIIRIEKNYRCIDITVISLFGPGGEMLVHPGCVGPAHFLKLFLDSLPHFLLKLALFK